MRQTDWRVRREKRPYMDRRWMRLFRLWRLRLEKSGKPSAHLGSERTRRKCHLHVQLELVFHDSLWVVGPIGLIEGLPGFG